MSTDSCFADRNVKGVYRLAQVYDVGFVVEACETHLESSTCEISLVGKLIAAQEADREEFGVS